MPEPDYTKEWVRDPALPAVKYQSANGQINVTLLVNHIVSRLPTTNFRDYVEYDDVVGKLMEEVWPKWMKYFPSIMLFEVSRVVRNTLRKETEITFDSGSDV